MTNKEVAQLLRNVAAAYALKGGNRFQIAAYETAADSVERLSSDLKDIWEEGRLESLPGIGSHIAGYLEELYKEGKVSHFEEVFEDIPEATFSFIKIPGVGPKTAYKIAQSGVVSIADLEKRIQSGYLRERGFGEKTLNNIKKGIEEFKRKSERILLPFAWETAVDIINYLKSHPDVVQANPLGSLRRMVATVGDVDISVASLNPQKVIDYFTKYQKVERVVESGDRTATIALKNGIRVDLMVQPPQHYGSLLQHFTGSKAHNVHLRNLALSKGYSLSEYGVKEEATNKLISCPTEDKLYQLLGLQTPPPELREDMGEIEAAEKHRLPKLVRQEEIKGDFHAHSIWSDGQNTISEMAEAAQRMGYQYLALTDHSYPSLDYQKRIKQIEQYNYSQDKIRVIIGLEVNINADSTLQISNELLAKHELIIASIHTGFRQSKDQITQRLISAIKNPHVHIIGHPTGRLLLEREGYEADWSAVFYACLKYGKMLEINAFPNRLDLTDYLVREAVSRGVKLVIDTDSHQAGQLGLMSYGIAVAKRGWARSENVVNTQPLEKIKKILNIS